MTERLYYKDSTILIFEADIVEVGTIGEKFYTVLNRSAFYPTSGGQQFDSGTINDVQIVDVFEGENKEIKHISNQKIGEVGDKVSGQINAERRLKHKQQHTAQHILSQAMFRLYDFKTESVHLGAEYGAIEIEAKDVSADQLREIEKLSNSAITKNYPIEILFVNDNEIDKLPMRRPPKVKGEIRVIKIGDFECTACGGTHCSSSAEVQLIKIIGIEKIRKRVLVLFLSGIQAVEDYQKRFAISNLISKRLTCHFEDLPQKFEKLEELNKSLKYELLQIQKEQIPEKAKQLAETFTLINNHKVSIAELTDFDKTHVRKLSKLTADLLNSLSVLLYEGKVIISASDETTFDAASIASAISAKSDLKGGGNKQQAQLGGGTTLNSEDIKRMLEDIL